MTTMKRRPPGPLPSTTLLQPTTIGNIFITVSYHKRQPFEVLITQKGGSEEAAFIEALGRMLSFILQIDDPGTPSERLRLVVAQLENIGSDSPVGFGPERVSSLPDGVAKALGEYLGDMNLLESG